MDQPEDDRTRRIAPTSPRRRVRRAALSALAGGGLTAAGLAAIASAASGAETAGTLQTATEEASGSTPPPPAPPAKKSGVMQEATEESAAGSGGSSHSTTTTTTVPQPVTPAPAKRGGSAEGKPAAPKVVLPKKAAKAKPAPKKAGKPNSSAKNPAATTTGPAQVLGNNVALAPQVIAAQAGAFAAELANSAASIQALGFYRIPLFLLPIYQAAAEQYGVPWQILAAINEIETNYGADLSVSSAGAVGWMQFMPATWLQYGVDALDAGYADPYNPVDAVFAAARYLRAAGAPKNLRAAILAYNHSEEYVSSVLLRAKLISTYPRSVVATLTGLIDGRLPVTGKQVGWGALLPSRSSATGNATAAGEPSSAAKAPASPVAEAASAAQAPGAAAAPSPASAATSGRGKARPHSEPPLQLVDLMSTPNANVVAVQDGRIMRIGETRELGKYVVLSDVYGDLFTYAGLGSIAPTYTPRRAPSAAPQSPAATIADTHDRAPSQPATAGRQLPLTLQVKVPSQTRHANTAHRAVVPAEPAEAAPAGMGKV